MSLVTKYQNGKQGAQRGQKGQPPSGLLSDQDGATGTHEFTKFRWLPLELREMIWEFYLLDSQPPCVVLIHDGPSNHWQERVADSLMPKPTSIWARVCKVGSNKPYYRPVSSISREVYATAKRLKWTPLPQFNITRDVASSNHPHSLFGPQETVSIDLGSDLLYIATNSLQHFQALKRVRWASHIRNLAVRAPTTQASGSQVVDSFFDVLPRLTRLKIIYFVTPVKRFLSRRTRDYYGFIQGRHHYPSPIRLKYDGQLRRRRLGSYWQVDTVFDITYSPSFIDDSLSI
ncbi:hypothetical protein Hte_002171 [Hypoxylon texense]